MRPPMEFKKPLFERDMGAELRPPPGLLSGCGQARDLRPTSETAGAGPLPCPRNIARLCDSSRPTYDLLQIAAIGNDKYLLSRPDIRSWQDTPASINRKRQVSAALLTSESSLSNGRKGALACCSTGDLKGPLSAELSLITKAGLCDHIAKLVDHDHRNAQAVRSVWIAMLAMHAAPRSEARRPRALPQSKRCGLARPAAPIRHGSRLSRY